MVMPKLKDYLISFMGLKLGKHQFDYQIDKEFFNLFDYDEFQSISVQCRVELNKKENMLELTLHHEGSVLVNCDLTNEEFDQPIQGDLQVVVKFGEEYNDDHDEILILPHGEHQVSVAQYIYESILLSIPQKRIHPGVADGTLESKALDYLDNQENNEEEQEQSEDDKESETDPRWDKLKQLLTDK